ncbi:MAG: hypothetical protein AAGF12_42395 [Myxococcota bacterium]
MDPTLASVVLVVIGLVGAVAGFSIFDGWARSEPAWTRAAKRLGFAWGTSGMTLAVEELQVELHHSHRPPLSGQLQLRVAFPTPLRAGFLLQRPPTLAMADLVVDSPDLPRDFRVGARERNYAEGLVKELSPALRTHAPTHAAVQIDDFGASLTHIVTPDIKPLLEATVALARAVIAAQTSLGAPAWVVDVLEAWRSLEGSLELDETALRLRGRIDDDEVEVRAEAAALLPNRVYRCTHAAAEIEAGFGLRIGRPPEGPVEAALRQAAPDPWGAVVTGEAAKADGDGTKPGEGGTKSGGDGAQSGEDGAQSGEDGAKSGGDHAKPTGDAAFDARFPGSRATAFGISLEALLNEETRALLLGLPPEVQSLVLTSPQLTYTLTDARPQTLRALFEATPKIAQALRHAVAEARPEPAEG